MPSTYAHYRMGQEVIKQVSSPACDIIMKHKQLYDIGLHGPDILFYYHPLVTNPVNAIGYGLHERSGKYFFGKAAGIIETASDKEAALAYIYGLRSGGLAQPFRFLKSTSRNITWNGSRGRFGTASIVWVSP